MSIRTLRPHERAALLELLDGWQLPDGWRGRDFFRRYLDDDPSYADENVFVAEEAGRLVACVQIFPRALRVAGHGIATGGIGSVFTRTETRGSGIASALLDAAVETMRARGMLLSLLFAERIAFYTRAGWTSWASTRTLLRREADAAPPARLEGDDASVDAFEVGRDLAAVRAIHASYSGVRDGTVVRDETGWRGSLHLAGNPAEDFRVARRGGELLAYARAVRLHGVLVVSEVGRHGDGAGAAADLLGRMLEPRADDPLAAPEKPSGELRRFAVAPPLLDAALEDALLARGIAAKSLPDPSPMLRCLDAAALAHALDDRVGSGEDGTAYLRRILPPERFGFWPADRF
ncbi:MAG TPA: GNAT family N-acetyltransferase [Myxococcota bacterium]|jgi:GNAT superfamily N-acetyltransferase|nr:GNAT family N-acetyltransferase [Myxococcota bacterium]